MKLGILFLLLLLCVSLPCAAAKLGNGKGVANPIGGGAAPPTTPQPPTKPPDSTPIDLPPRDSITSGSGSVKSRDDGLGGVKPDIGQPDGVPQGNGKAQPGDGPIKGPNLNDMPSSIQVPEVGELDRKYCDHLRSLRAAIESRLSSSPDQLRAFRATPE